jgi:hypothetical protein
MLNTARQGRARDGHGAFRGPWLRVDAAPWGLHVLLFIVVTSPLHCCIAASERLRFAIFSVQ